MGIKSKMIGQTEMKNGGDIFHDIFKKRPHHLSSMAPQKVLGFTLLEGELGIKGSVIRWDYTHDEKQKTSKQIIELIDEEKKSIVFKLIDGDLMELYKNMFITYHVDIKGANSLITWTLEYEKLDVDTPHPGTLLNFFLHMTEDIEHHHQDKEKTPK